MVINSETDRQTDGRTEGQTDRQTDRPRYVCSSGPHRMLLFDMDPRQALADTAVELVLVDCHRVTKDEYLGRLVVSPFDGDRPGQVPGTSGDVRGPCAGVSVGERPIVAGSDRPVAVWHRLAAR